MATRIYPVQTKRAERFLQRIDVALWWLVLAVLVLARRSTYQACYCWGNRPFAVYEHMVQKPPCWRANRPLGHSKQKNIKLSCFVLDVPVGSWFSSMAVFVPLDRKLQRAYSLVPSPPFPCPREWGWVKVALVDNNCPGIT